MEYNFIDNSQIAEQMKNKCVNEFLNTFSEKALAETQDITPVVSGNLRGSFETLVEDEEAYVGTDCEYATPVEIGSLTHKAHNMLRDGCLAAISSLKNFKI